MERMIKFMNPLIERYIYDVVNRLPEGKQKEVKKELEADIYDMLPENPEEKEIREVLTKFGPPAALAAQYRKKPGYLISPAMYDSYIKALKIIVPVSISTLFLIAASAGISNILNSSTKDVSERIKTILEHCISSGMEGAFRAFVWVTIGFAIADRFRRSSKASGKTWSVDDLPQIPISVKMKKTISRTGSIAELVMIVIVTLFCILLYGGWFLEIRRFRDTGTEFLNNEGILTAGFLSMCVPVFLLSAFFGIYSCYVKIIKRRWSAPICIISVIESIACMAAFIFLVSRPEVFTSEFISTMQQSEWLGRNIFEIIKSSNMFPALASSAVLIVCYVSKCIYLLYKLFKKNAPETLAAD